MAIVKFDPFRGFESLTRRMNQFMNEFDRDTRTFDNSRVFLPKVNIREDKENIYVDAEIPGVKKDDIKLTLNQDNILEIRGERKAEEKKEGENYIRYESSYGEFTRSFMLPDAADSEQISAEYKDGMLRLSIGKKEEVKPKEKEIAIN